MLTLLHVVSLWPVSKLCEIKWETQTCLHSTWKYDGTLIGDGAMCFFNSQEEYQKSCVCVCVRMSIYKLYTNRLKYIKQDDWDTFQFWTPNPNCLSLSWARSCQAHPLYSCILTIASTNPHTSESGVLTRMRLRQDERPSIKAQDYTNTGGVCTLHTHCHCSKDCLYFVTTYFKGVSLPNRALGPWSIETGFYLLQCSQSTLSNIASISIN